jgi:putative membrane protein
MFLRLQPFVYVSALTLAALGCKTETIPSRGPNTYATNEGPAVVTQGAGESGVDSETSAPLPQSAVKTAEDKFDTRSVESPSSRARSAKENQPKLDDAEIAAITEAANSAEIEQGRLAREKARDPRVRDFAAMMVDHHGQAQKDQQKLNLEPTASADSKRMQGDAEDALKALKQKSGREFDRAYLQLQIEEHRKVLSALNDQLLPSAKDAKLEAYLEDIKPKVESHLAQAERLQQELNGTSSLKDTERPSPSTTRAAAPTASQR